MSGPRVLFVRQTTAKKLGPMPVTYTERATCPPECPLRDRVQGSGDRKGPCYAQAGFHTSRAWDRADNAPDGSWDRMLHSVQALPPDTLWRHDVAGDLPGTDGFIDHAALASLVDANAGRKGYTYTHYDIGKGDNLAAVRDANARGFTVNLSANNLEHADRLAETGLPVAVLLPQAMAHRDARPVRTPAGRVVIVCPETTGRVRDCASCGLCARMRPQIIGFPVHGTGKRLAEAIAEGGTV